MLNLQLIQHRIFLEVLGTFQGEIHTRPHVCVASRCNHVELHWGASLSPPRWASDSSIEVVDCHCNQVNIPPQSHLHQPLSRKAGATSSEDSWVRHWKWKNRGMRGISSPADRKGSSQEPGKVISSCQSPTGHREHESCSINLLVQQQQGIWEVYSSSSAFC